MNLDQRNNKLEKTIYSYKDINELHNVYYTVRPFTEFEISIFNFHINADTLIIEEMNNCDELYSLCAFYEIYKCYNKVINIVNRLLMLGDVRGYLKLGVYLLNYKNDKPKALEIFRIGAKKGNITCIYNIGIECIQNEKYQEAITYFLKGIEQNMFDVCVNMFYCYGKLGDISTAYKYLLLGIKNNDEKSMETFCISFNEYDVYYILLKLNFTNEMIQNKINKLRPRLINEKYIHDILIHSDTGDLLDINFDVFLSKKENELICNDLQIDGYIDIFEYLEDLKKQEDK